MTVEREYRINVSRDQARRIIEGELRGGVRIKSELAFHEVIKDYVMLNGLWRVTGAANETAGRWQDADELLTKYWDK